METQNKLFDVSRFPIRKIHLDTSTACFDVADVAGPCRCFWSKATVLFQVVHPSRIRKWIESHPTRIYQGYFLQWKLGLDILFVIYHLTCFFFRTSGRNSSSWYKRLHNRHDMPVIAVTGSFRRHEGLVSS